MSFYGHPQYSEGQQQQRLPHQQSVCMPAPYPQQGLGFSNFTQGGSLPYSAQGLGFPHNTACPQQNQTALGMNNPQFNNSAIPGQQAPVIPRAGQMGYPSSQTATPGYPGWPVQPGSAQGTIPGYPQSGGQSGYSQGGYSGYPPVTSSGHSGQQTTGAIHGQQVPMQQTPAPYPGQQMQSQPPWGGYGAVNPSQGGFSPLTASQNIYNQAATVPGSYNSSFNSAGVSSSASAFQSGYSSAVPSQGSYNSAIPLQGCGGSSQLSARPGLDQFASKVELRLECRNLLDRDILSKSDPCAVLFMFRNGRYEEIGRTENVKNCLNPRFAKQFMVDYFFEKVQKMLIAVYDIDNATPQLSDDDFLGQVETTLGQVVSGTPFTKPLLLRSGQKAGQGVLIVRAEEIKEGTERVAMTFHARKLDRKDFLGKSDPFLEIQRAAPNGTWLLVHRTEIVKNNLNPSWRPFEVPITSLCGGNKQQSIKFDVYDWDSDGSSELIGGFTTTLEEMLKASQQEVSWPCIHPTKKAKKKSYQNSGIVTLSSCKLLKTHTFLDYIFGGMQINFTVGIDFTGSNGHPSKPTSLHYLNPQQPNEYMQAIRAVGDVCQDYDTDKFFPALGFGAKIPPNPEVLHEFAINFNPQNPYCAGIDGVLQAYFNCIHRVELYGPTYAAPIINHVAKFAAAAQREEPQKGAHAYCILLMLTDGVLNDMSNTRQAIVNASRLPMSIIIVGVGNADFTDMNELDGDNGVLRAPNGEVAKRDIVQFVPFRDFKMSSSVELASFVLAEVPKQVTDYYKMCGLPPKKPPS